MVGALAGIDDPLETLEGVGVRDEGVGGSAFQGDFDIFYDERIVGVVPEIGLDAAHPAEAPFVCNESVYELDLLGIGRAVVLAVFGGEIGEILGFFVEQDLVNGEDTVLQGVESGYGLSSGYARAG